MGSIREAGEGDKSACEMCEETHRRHTMSPPPSAGDTAFIICQEGRRRRGNNNRNNNNRETTERQANGVSLRFIQIWPRLGGPSNFRQKRTSLLIRRRCDVGPDAPLRPFSNRFVSFCLCPSIRPNRSIDDGDVRGQQRRRFWSSSSSPSSYSSLQGPSLGRKINQEWWTDLSRVIDDSRRLPLLWLGSIRITACVCLCIHVHLLLIHLPTRFLFFFFSFCWLSFHVFCFFSSDVVVDINIYRFLSLPPSVCLCVFVGCSRM